MILFIYVLKEKKLIQLSLLSHKESVKKFHVAATASYYQFSFVLCMMILSASVFFVGSNNKATTEFHLQMFSLDIQIPSKGCPSPDEFPFRYSLRRRLLRKS
jgi:hypothetical protein